MKGAWGDLRGRGALHSPPKGSGPCGPRRFQRRQKCHVIHPSSLRGETNL